MSSFSLGRSCSGQFLMAIAACSLGFTTHA
jgi:hypothetical protein